MPPLMMLVLKVMIPAFIKKQVIAHSFVATNKSLTISIAPQKESCHVSVMQLISLLQTYFTVSLRKVQISDRQESVFDKDRKVTS